MFGMWAPETENKNFQAFYKFWSFFCRGFFFHAYTLTQLLYFKDVVDLAVKKVIFTINSIIF